MGNVCWAGESVVLRGDSWLSSMGLAEKGTFGGADAATGGRSSLSSVCRLGVKDEDARDDGVDAVVCRPNGTIACDMCDLHSVVPSLGKECAVSSLWW